MQIKSIRQAKNLSGKKILLRVDFNVPFSNGEIKDDFKIRSCLLTIAFLLKQECRVIIISHITSHKSLRPIAIRLKKILLEEHLKLTKSVRFIDNCFGFETEEDVAKMKNGDILVLENLRKYPEEAMNDSVFAKRLARLADIYVNNAFAVSHRAHASVSAITRHIPSYGGLLLEREVGSLNKILNPKKPFVIVMGGIKLETKIPLIIELYKKADFILLGGGLANTFLKLVGSEVGISEIGLSNARILKRTVDSETRRKVLTPIDAIIKSYDKHRGEVITSKRIEEVGAYDRILDIGPETIKLYSSIIKKADTIVWNGPLGKFEDKRFSHGTMAIGKIIAARSTGPAFGVAGGGETVEALHMTKMSDFMDWVSTGGGAMLAYLSGKTMPGLNNIKK